jgi:hypothetical protein
MKTLFASTSLLVSSVVQGFVIFPQHGSQHCGAIVSHSPQRHGIPSNVESFNSQNGGKIRMSNSPSTEETVPGFSGFGHHRAKLEQYHHQSSTATATTTAPETSVTSGVPGFSGFGHHHGMENSVDDNSELSNGVPGFSGFGHHVNGQTTKTITTSTISNTANAASETLKTVPGFTGFGHVLQDVSEDNSVPGFSGFGHVNGYASTSSQVPGFSGFGHSDPDVLSHQDDDNFDLNISLDDALMDPDLYEAATFLQNAKDKVMQLRQELEGKAQQQKELVRELRVELE